MYNTRIGNDVISQRWINASEGGRGGSAEKRQQRRRQTRGEGDGERGRVVCAPAREREMEGEARGLHGSAGGSEREGGFSRNAARARARTPGSLGWVMLVFPVNTSDDVCGNVTEMYERSRFRTNTRTRVYTRGWIILALRSDLHISTFRLSLLWRLRSRAIAKLPNVWFVCAFQFTSYVRNGEVVFLIGFLGDWTLNLSV